LLSHDLKALWFGRANLDNDQIKLAILDSSRSLSRLRDGINKFLASEETEYQDLRSNELNQVPSSFVMSSRSR
jgi:hypothetical protein